MITSNVWTTAAAAAPTTVMAHRLSLTQLLSFYSSHGEWRENAATTICRRWTISDFWFMLICIARKMLSWALTVPCIVLPSFGPFRLKKSISQKPISHSRCELTRKSRYSLACSFFLKKKRNEIVFFGILWVFSLYRDIPFFSLCLCLAWVCMSFRFGTESYVCVRKENEQVWADEKMCLHVFHFIFI